MSLPSTWDLSINREADDSKTDINLMEGTPKAKRRRGPGRGQPHHPEYGQVIMCTQYSLLIGQHELSLVSLASFEDSNTGALDSCLTISK